MSKHWCPIEKRECGNTGSSIRDRAAYCRSTGAQLFYFNDWPEVERCPFPSRIKEVAPDPGEGYELVPYDPCVLLQDGWEVWRGTGYWAETDWAGVRMDAPNVGKYYRRPIHEVCPVSGERCKHADKDGDYCEYGQAYLNGGGEMEHKPEVCPWPSKKGV